MLSNVVRVLRLISMVAGLVAGVMEMRSMYLKRKHLWNILRRLIRQTG
ncbi:MAG: hypothetical protein ACXVDB_08540 [Tumebacillaceae bacterium]